MAKKKITKDDALEILKNYNGDNNYLINIRNLSFDNPNFYLTDSQIEYISLFNETKPKVARKWVELDSYYAKMIADDKLLVKVPEKMWVEKLLVEKEKSYHIFGRFFENDRLNLYWIPKDAIVVDKTNKDVVVDFEKYSHRKPFKHQEEAIIKLLENDKFILALDMGLGKTSAAIIASIEVKPSKTLIICPASLKQNWEREIKNYTNKPIYICEGKKYDDSADYVIINYDIIKNFHSLKTKEESIIQKSEFDLVIIDECHMIKNPQASRTKLINDICKDINKIWLLTGTPLTSRPIDYFNLLSLVDSPVARNWMAYVKRYCAGYQFTVGMNKVWNVNGASNLDELRERTSPLLLRLLKENVLDLPEKIITPVYLTLKSKEYENVMGEYFDWVKNNPKESKSLSVQFTKLMKVRQIIADEKIKNTIELIENTLEQERKVIVFSNFTNSLYKIYEHFKKIAVKLDGSSTMKQRQDSVDKFQNEDKIKVFVGNIKAAGVGLTLTSADVVIFNDLSFVPADHSQAEDRAYRIGQKNSVSVLYPIFENTIEGIIYDMLDRKKKIISTVLGDNLIEGDVSEDILTQILNFGK
jgi:SWI/SNF-related matrix-associated actin-dependent regulator of chromatin subfamily A-like protein 1